VLSLYISSLLKNKADSMKRGYIALNEIGDGRSGNPALINKRRVSKQSRFDVDEFQPVMLSKRPAEITGAPLSVSKIGEIQEDNIWIWIGAVLFLLWYSQK